MNTLTKIGRIVPLSEFSRTVAGHYDRRDLERGNLALRLERLAGMAQRRYERRRRACNKALGTWAMCRHWGPRQDWERRKERARALEVEAERLWRALAGAAAQTRGAA